MNLKISDYKEGDEIEILTLFELVFNKPMSLDYWNWRFCNNPAGTHKIKLMWDNDILAGHYAVSPVKMVVNGTVANTALSMTTMTHPSYIGNGIFGELAKSLYGDLGKIGYKMIWGFPNNNSHYGFIKNLFWKDIGLICSLTLEYRLLNSRMDEEIKIASLFTKEHSELLEDLCSAQKIYTLRDADYLNWRYIDNPENNYTIFEFRSDNGELESFIVVKLFLSNNEGLNEVDIMELGCSNPLKSLPRLLESVSNFYKLNDVRFNCWISLYDKRFITLEKLGFKLRGNPTYLGARILNGEGDTVDNMNNWYLSFSDSDVY